MSVSSLYIESQLRGLERFGFPRDRALEALGASDDDIDNPRYRASLESVANMHRAAAQALARPSLAVDLGADFRVATFAKTGRIYAFCENIRHVVEVNARYQKVAIDAGTASLVEEDGRAFLHFEPNAEAASLDAIIDVIFGSYATAFTWLGWASGRDNVAAYFARPTPPNGEAWEYALGCPVIFEAEHNRLEFHPAAVDSPLPTADPHRLARMRERLERLLESSTGSVGALEQATRAAISVCLRNGAVNMDCVAERLDRSTRRLRADLAKAGLNFRDLLDDVRKEVYHHERERGHSFAEVAQRLCYNDQAAFNRAFKRWFGRTPTEFESVRRA